MPAPARWVSDWLAADQDPQALAAVWSKIVAQEDDHALRHPRETLAAVIEGLLELKIAALRHAHLGAEAASSVLRLMERHHGDPAALAKLLQWSIEQKDWDAQRLLEEQGRAMIVASPDLLYLAAEAQAIRGDAAAAERFAPPRLKLNPEVDDQTLQAHYQAGLVLEDRGRHQWAAREWDHVVHDAPPESKMGILAARSLAELYHDLEQRRPGGRDPRPRRDDSRRAVQPLETAGRRGPASRGRVAGPPALFSRPASGATRATGRSSAPPWMRPWPRGPTTSKSSSNVSIWPTRQPTTAWASTG